MARCQAPPQGLSHPIHLQAYPLRSKHPRAATPAIRFCHDDSSENDKQANSCMMAHLASSSHTISYLLWLKMLKYACTESRTPAHTARLTGTVIIIGEGWQTGPSPRRVHSGILPGMLLPVARCHGRILPQSHYNTHTHTMIKPNAMRLHLKSASIFPFHLDIFFHLVFTSLSPKQYKQGTAL